MEPYCQCATRELPNKPPFSFGLLKSGFLYCLKGTSFHLSSNKCITFFTQKNRCLQQLDCREGSSRSTSPEQKPTVPWQWQRPRRDAWGKPVSVRQLEKFCCSGKAPTGVQYLRNKQVTRFQGKAPSTIIKASRLLKKNKEIEFP